MPGKPASLPKEVHIIADLPALQVVADPLRLRLLAQLRREPQTAKQLAAALGVAQTKLYYHLKLLEEHDLIRVTETRIVSGIIEKRYGVTAYRLSVARTLLSPDAPAPDEGLDTFLSLVLDHTKAEIRRSVRAGLIDLGQQPPLDSATNATILGRLWYRLTPAEAARFMARLGELTAEFADLHPADTVNPAVRFYEMLLGFYAVAPPEQASSRLEEGPPADP